MIKSPVQLLNERCAKEGLPFPFYDYEQKQTLPTTIFQATCALTLNDQTFVAIGLGQKKKDAQQNAAKSMFSEHLKIGYDDQEGFKALFKPLAMEEEVQQFIQAVGRTSLNQRELVVDDGDYPGANVGNPIAELDEYCRVHQLPSAEYDMKVDLEGPSHCPVLSVPCKVGNLVLSGRSKKTKKVAKRIAAMKVLQELRNRMAATGSFGSDVKTVLASSEPSEVLKHLSLLDNNNANGATNCQKRSKDKTYNDFCTRANAFNQNNEFANKLGNHPGPHLQEVLTFARTVDEKHPLVAYPQPFYETWLQAHSKGILGFYQELKKELLFEESWKVIPATDRNASDKFMVILGVKLPDIEFEPVAITMGNDVDVLKKEAVIYVIAYIGTKTVEP